MDIKDIDKLFEDYEVALQQYISGGIEAFSSSEKNKDIYILLLDIDPEYFSVKVGINTLDHLEQLKQSGSYSASEFPGLDGIKYYIDDFLIRDTELNESVYDITSQLSTLSELCYNCENYPEEFNDISPERAAKIKLELKPRFEQANINVLKMLEDNMKKLNLTDDYIAMVQCYSYNVADNDVLAKKTISTELFETLFQSVKVIKDDDFDPNNESYLIEKIRNHYVGTAEPDVIIDRKLIKKYEQALTSLMPKIEQIISDEIINLILNSDDSSNESNYVSLFNKEGKYLGVLSRIFLMSSKAESYKTEEIYKKTIKRLCSNTYEEVSDNATMSIAPSNLARILHFMNPDIYPDVIESEKLNFYLKNHADYLK